MDDSVATPPANFDLKAEIAAYWDGRAEGFDASPFHAIRPGPEEAAWQALLRRHLPEGKAPKVLELGCGTGVVTLQLVKRGCRVTAVDLGERMLAKARAKAKAAGAEVRFLYGDAEDPFMAGSGFDAVVCRHVLWTLPDPRSALGRWYEALRPGGRVLVIDHDGGSPGALRRLLRGLAVRLDDSKRPTLDDPDSPYARIAAHMPYGIRGMPAAAVAGLLAAGGFADPKVDAMAGVRRAQFMAARGTANRLRALAAIRYLVAARKP